MSFDLLAPHYRWMEAVLAGARLQRCRTWWLGELGPVRRILVAGAGHGPALPELRRHHHAAHIVCVDASAGMLAVAQRRVAGDAGIDFVRARLPDWTPAGGPFDAIITDFFLDCFPPDELGAVIGGLARVATVDAHWLVADFSIPARGPARWRAQAVHALMYLFFRRTTRLPARRMTPPDELLRAAGFRLLRRREFEWGLLRADCWRRAGLAPLC